MRALAARAAVTVAGLAATTAGSGILLHHVRDRSEQARARRQAQTQHRRSAAPRRRHCRRRAEHFGRGLVHVAAIDHGQRIGESAQQRAVAQQVDAPRHAARQLVDALAAPCGRRAAAAPGPHTSRRCCMYCARFRLGSARPGDSARSRAAPAAPARAAPACVRSSGWPIRMICSSLRSLVSRLVSRRSCSSTSADRFCASSMISTLLRPAAWACSRNSLSGSR